MPKKHETFEDLYVVTELMDYDLHSAIRLCQRFHTKQIQYLAFNLFEGLKYMHSTGVVHRDLKPGNLLINFDLDLKVADYGLAKYISSDVGTAGDLTNYVVTRWYRPPELILKYGRDNYDSKLDMWSVGCILAEMVLRKVLF